MGLLSWLFPSDEERLRKARAHMAAGRFEKARAGLVHCRAPEAEALYETCCAALEKDDRARLKTQLAASGFFGWKVEVTVKGAKLKAELERLIADELARADIDLGLPDVDEAALRAALGRAQRRMRSGSGAQAAVRLVPIKDGAGAAR